MPQSHVVQFYSDDEILARNVAYFLKEGAERGDWMVVIAGPDHQHLFTRVLIEAGTDIRSLIRAGRLLLLDAESILEKVVDGSMPDWDRFDAVVGSLIRDLQARAGSAAVRAYGEMVDLLWKKGSLTGATTLEDFWNRLLRKVPVGLFCAYTLDLLGQKAQSDAAQQILGAHCHLVPVSPSGELNHALNHAMSEVLGPAEAHALKPLIRANQPPHAV